MRRLWCSLLIVFLFAACSSAPQKTARSTAGPSMGAYRTTPPSDFPDFVDHSVGREEISIQAMSLVGVPYRWGGNTPDSGFDCSGLVRYVVSRAASVNLPRTTADMSMRGEPVEPDQIAPGDLIFFNTTGRPHSHVGIYVGKLRFVNAPSTGGTVRLDYLTNSYWAKRFDGIRRIAAPVAAPVAAPFDTPLQQASVVPEAAPEKIAPTPLPLQPSDIGTAQPQARSVGGMSQTGGTGAAPTETSGQDAPRPSPDAPTAGEPAPSVETGSTPDAIDAAADAFEPPPPAAVAVRQAQQAQQVETRESSAPADRQRAPVFTPPRSTASPDDDPIAHFANGNF